MAPYRQPAAPPGAPAPPARILATICNVIVGALLLGSFGSCVAFGCQSDHLSRDTSLVAIVVSLVLCVFASRVSVHVLRKNGINAAGTSAFGIATAIVMPVFWLISSAEPFNIGLGGWGRPLRVRRRSVTPGVRASSEWAKGPRPSVDGLDATTREVLRDLWLHDARKEHASVPAFAQVAWQLVALGAPSDLVRRAHHASLQEIDHAERCFALASAYAGEDLGVQEMPALFGGASELPRNVDRALCKVAVEALIDGALLEDYNAELAATALDDARDPAAREALIRVVEDEREHASLAWDIVAFCIDRGGPRVVRALEEAFARISDQPVSLYDENLSRRVAALPDKTLLYAHGRVRLERAGEVFRARKAAARGCLSELVQKQRAA